MVPASADGAKLVFDSDSGDCTIPGNFGADELWLTDTYGGTVYLNGELWISNYWYMGNGDLEQGQFPINVNCNGVWKNGDINAQGADPATINLTGNFAFEFALGLNGRELGSNLEIGDGFQLNFTGATFKVLKGANIDVNSGGVFNWTGNGDIEVPAFVLSHLNCYGGTASVASPNRQCDLHYFQSDGQLNVLSGSVTFGTNVHGSDSEIVVDGGTVFIGDQAILASTRSSSFMDCDIVTEGGHRSQLISRVTRWSYVSVTIGKTQTGVDTIGEFTVGGDLAWDHGQLYVSIDAQTLDSDVLHVARGAESGLGGNATIDNTVGVNVAALNSGAGIPKNKYWQLIVADVGTSVLGVYAESLPAGLTLDIAANVAGVKS
jgi:hypothetical protein